MARKSSSNSGGFLFKTGIFAALAGLAFWLFNHFGSKTPENNPDSSVPVEQPASAETSGEQVATCQVPDDILPASAGEIVRHTWYVLAYNEDYEQAEWVAYQLTRQHLNENHAERPNTFRPDPDVRTESATPRDYASSGYDKGHLCPAADMAFDSKAIDETFYMSNISPQVPAFNVGIWRELEELTRDWARKFKDLYVVTGPVLRPGRPHIGFSKVAVPEAFYKVLYAPDQEKSIAFVIPNELGNQSVMSFSCNIDQVEELTGIDFFPKLLNGPNEAIEASLDRSIWPVNAAREEQRIKEWNLR